MLALTAADVHAMHTTRVDLSVAMHDDGAGTRETRTIPGVDCLNVAAVLRDWILENVPGAVDGLPGSIPLEFWSAAQVFHGGALVQPRGVVVLSIVETVESSAGGFGGFTSARWTWYF